MEKNINTKISQQWRLAEITGYQPVTDYWDRFGESEELGVSGVFECYTELLDESKGNCRKITELATVTSHKVLFSTLNDASFFTLNGAVSA